jgi:putative hydrolase of the HAD superfamily
VTAVRAVLLDFYGTLAAAVPGSQEPFGDFLAARGYEGGRWTYEYDADHVEHSTDAAAYAAFVRDNHRRALEACGVGPDDMEQLLDDMSVWATGYEIAAYPDVAEALKALRDKGLRLAICSNWDWDLSSFVAQAGLAGLVDVEVTSAQAGYRKPRPEIYAHTLGLLDVEAADAVFVGDTWDADVQGPLEAGMRPVHLWRDDHPDRVPPPLPEGVARISSLDQLLEVL